MQAHSPSPGRQSDSSSVVPSLRPFDVFPGLPVPLFLIRGLEQFSQPRARATPLGIGGKQRAAPAIRAPFQRAWFPGEARQTGE